MTISQKVMRVFFNQDIRKILMLHTTAGPVRNRQNENAMSQLEANNFSCKIENSQDSKIVVTDSISPDCRKSQVCGALWMGGVKSSCATANSEVKVVLKWWASQVVRPLRCRNLVGQPEVDRASPDWWAKGSSYITLIMV